MLLSLVRSISDEKKNVIDCDLVFVFFVAGLEVIGHHGLQGLVADAWNILRIGVG